MSLRTRLNLNVVVLLILAMALGGGGGLVDAAPFTLPAGVSVAAAVVYDGTPKAIQELTSEQATITSDTGEGSARKVVESAGGKFRLVQAGSTDEQLKYEDDWVKAAYAKRGTDVPWIVAAGVKGGLSQSVPKTVKSADVVSRLKVISGK